MKTISKLASGLALVAISSSAMAAAAFTGPGSGIAQTKHNLGAGNMTGGNYTNATTEICIFCHTPHGSDQGAAAPLWNRKLNSTSIYTRYSSLGTTSFDAAEAPIGSVSIACLSCHDGTQAMDAVLNSPGGGTGFANTGISAFGMDSIPDAVGSLAGTLSGVGGWNETNKLSALAAADFGNTGDLIYIGTDLRNDHPVSMQYGGGGINSTNAAIPTTTNDPDYASATGDSTSAGTWGTNVSLGGTGKVNTRVLANAASTRVWWVDTGGSGQQKTDMPLYTRTDAAGATSGVVQPFVECATCHDPHTNNGTFLRAPAVVNGNGSNGNGGSQVCLACHKK